MRVIISVPPKDGDDMLAAAAIAGIISYMNEEAPQQLPARSAWSAAAVLHAQQLPAAHAGAYATWGKADRAARASRWSRGIVGM